MSVFLKDTRAYRARKDQIGALLSELEFERIFDILNRFIAGVSIEAGVSLCLEKCKSSAVFYFGVSEGEIIAQDGTLPFDGFAIPHACNYKDPYELLADALGLGRYFFILGVGIDLRKTPENYAIVDAMSTPINIKPGANFDHDYTRN